jgi:Zn-dependent protease
MNATGLLEIFIWVGVIILSILIHEYGHALTAVAFKQRATIELVMYGGVTRRSGKPLSKWQEFIIVFNGPLFGALLGALAYILLKNLGPHLNAISVYALTVTFYINTFWTILNLLPVFPLDGGQLLVISMQGIFGLRGLKIALLFSTIIALVAGVTFFAISALLPGIIFIMLTMESYRHWRSASSMTPTDENPAYQQQIRLADSLIKEGDIHGAEKILEGLTITTEKGVIHDTAIINLSNLYFKQGRYQSTLSLLKPFADKLDGQSLALLIQSALHANELDLITQYGNRAYQELPSYATALANAKCYARLNQATPAVGWIQCAMRDGIPNIKDVLHSPDFDLLRTNENWKNFLIKNHLPPS